MYLQMAILLALASTAIEGFIVWHAPLIRKIGKKFPVLDVVFSFALSVFMGMMFAAEGVVIALGSILSTIISMPLYPAMDWIDEHRSLVQIKKARAKEILTDTVKVIVFFLRVITFPLWMPRRIKHWFLSVSRT